MSASNTLKPLVLVTGVNGYIGATMVKTLLEQGYRVRGTIRGQSGPKTAALEALPGAAERLEFASVDLTSEDIEPFKNACRDVEWVFHLASPVDPKTTRQRGGKGDDAFVGPAVNGTSQLLKAASETPTVKRFILTSSEAAISAGHPAAKTTVSEEDWTNMEGPNVNSYDKSKTLAERAAWDFMKENKPQFTMTALHPGYVLGPVSSANSLSTTELIRRIMTAADPVLINMRVPVSDVRDVAQAFILAAKTDDAAGKRFLLTRPEDKEKLFYMPDVANILRKEFEPMGYTIRSKVLPRCFATMLSWFDADMAAVYRFLDSPIYYDSTQSIKVLGLTYRPVETTILDTAHSMIQLGAVPKLPKYKSGKE